MSQVPDPTTPDDDGAGPLTKSGRADRRHQRGQASLQRIIDATIATIAEEGLTAVTMQRVAARGAQPEPSDVAGARCVGLFDGPGWSLEMTLPLAALDLPTDGRLSLNLATEHLRGREHFGTLWAPTAGGLWQSERNGQALLD